MDSIFGAGCEVDQKLNSEKYFFSQHALKVFDDASNKDSN